MMQQSEFKRKYDPEIGKYTKQHIWSGERSIYGEGIMDSVKSFLKPASKRKPLTPPPPPKKVTFADKKAGDKIVKILSRESVPTTRKTTSHKKMTEKESNQYLENLRKQEDARRRLRGMCWCQKELPLC